MKHFYFKPLTIRLSIVVVIAFTAFIIHSCKKDNKQEQTRTVNSTNPTIDLAKKWYEQTYSTTNNTKQTTQSIGSRHHDWSKMFFPNWAGATIFMQDTLTFIELPVTKKGDMALAYTKPKDTANFDFGRSGTATHLLIVKQDSNFSMYAMTILADSSYLQGDYSKVNNNSYHQMDKDFTGAVFFNKMDGTFVNGWGYQNGVATRQLSAAPGTAVAQSNKLKVNVTQPIPPGCGAIVVVTLWAECTSYGSSVQVCNTYTTTDVYADCPSSPPNTGSTGSGGSSSSQPPPCVPPPAATPPANPPKPPADASAVN